ncbi:MAG: RluA family pseudouridine synthase [Parachlamydia sp.]|nr:RluA family pseudouridine synthase [Parachlamydia sp.]
MDMYLIDTLAQQYPDSSRTTLRSWIKEGRVCVDGQTVKNPQLEIGTGVVTLRPRSRFADGGIRILYEDRDLLVIDKPEGLLSVATAFEKEETAYALLRKKFRNIQVVHRLDQETSGVMMFALSEQGREGCKAMFEKHALQRVYYAVVEGQFTESKGTWRSYQYEDANYHVHTTDDPKLGKLAITHYAVKATTKRYSLLELTLETGRKNQIRVHCQTAGHPVAGDKKYGAKTNPGRLCLHAHLLDFQHPITGKSLRFTSDLPETFRKLI